MGMNDLEARKAVVHHISEALSIIEGFSHCVGYDNRSWEQTPEGHTFWAEMASTLDDLWDNAFDTAFPTLDDLWDNAFDTAFLNLEESEKSKL